MDKIEALKEIERLFSSHALPSAVHDYWRELNLPSLEAYTVILFDGRDPFGAALKFQQDLLPDWHVETMGQRDRNGPWWCTLQRPVKGNEETGEITRPGLSAGSNGKSTPAKALFLAALDAKKLELFQEMEANETD